MFDTEKAIELSKIEHPDELERQENAKKLFEHCKQGTCVYIINFCNSYNFHNIKKMLT